MERILGPSEFFPELAPLLHQKRFERRISFPIAYRKN
jgi:hypothetical protein